jgi:hypothetical protein
MESKSSDMFDRALRQAKVWLLPVSETERARIYQVIEASQTVDYGSYLNPFISRIRPYAKQLVGEHCHSEELLSSGLFCFYGGILFVLAQSSESGVGTGGPFHLIHDLFQFTLLYLFVDHYLDDQKVNGAEKAKTFSLMKQLLEDPRSLIDTAGSESTTGTHSSLTTMVELFISLVEKHPRALPWLKTVFYVEAQGMIIQQNGSLSRDVYLTTAEAKGGATTQAMQSLLFHAVQSNAAQEAKDLDLAHQLGACIQLVDDMLDVKEDQVSNIHTIATHDLKVNGNMDQLLCYTIDKICNMDKRWTVFKPIFMLILTYLISKGGFSPELQGLFLPISCFDHKHLNGLTVLNSWLGRLLHDEPITAAQPVN